MDFVAHHGVCALHCIPFHRFTYALECIICSFMVFSVVYAIAVCLYNQIAKAIPFLFFSPFVVCVHNSRHHISTFKSRAFISDIIQESGFFKLVTNCIGIESSLGRKKLQHFFCCHSIVFPLFTKNVAYLSWIFLEVKLRIILGKRNGFPFV